MPPLTPIAKKLLIINVAVFALLAILPYLGIDTRAAANYLALYYPGSEEFHPIQLVSHVFMHGGLTHLFFNMFGLFMFGPLIERRYGPRRFLILYFAAAAGAIALHFGYTWFQIERMEGIIQAFAADPNLADFDRFFRGVDLRSLSMDDGSSLAEVVANIQNELVLQRDDPAQTARQATGIMQEYVEFKQNIPMVGASGAIYGIVAAFAILYPDFPLMLIFLPIPIKARYFVPVLLAIELFLGVMEFSWDPIAHFAHLGGALLGGLLAYIWYRRDPPMGTRRWN